MTNKFVNASGLIFLASFFGVTCDILSKMTTMDVNSLLFLRFWFSFIVISICITFYKVSKKNFFSKICYFLIIHLTLAAILYSITVLDNVILQLWIVFFLLFYDTIRPNIIYSLITYFAVTISIMSKLPFSLINIVFCACGILAIFLINNFQPQMYRIFNLRNFIRGFLFGLSILIFVNGLKKLNMGLVILINFLTPVITTLLSKFFLQEKIKDRLIMCLFNTVGVFISIYPLIDNQNKQEFLLVMFSSLLNSILDVYNKHTLNKKENVPDILLGSSFFSCLFFSLLSICQEKFFNIPYNTDIILCFVIGLFALLIPFFILTASKYVELNLLQPIKYIEFPISILAGCFLFKEKYLISTYVGFLIVLIGVIFYFFYEKKRT